MLRKYLQTIPEEKQDSAAIAFLASLDHLRQHSPDVAKSIIAELQDQRSYLKLIASENYSSLATQLAMGNLLTDKYSEGYVGHRFYAGCENVDAVEDLASRELKTIFGCDHAYVQPHSGADANLVAFWAILENRIQTPEVERLGAKRLDELSKEDFESIRKLMVSQKMLGMGLNSGGHLTHGYRHNVSAKMMQAHTYEVDFETERLDYGAIAKQAKEVKPLILLAGYSAYPRLVNFAKMREIADSVGAVFMVDMAHFSGLVAGKALTGEYDPVPYADIVTSTTHKTMRGPRGGMILCKEPFKDSINRGCPLVLGGPLPHVMAAKAVAFKEANQESFKTYASQVVKNAKALAEGLMQRGVKLFTGGTDNHLVVADVHTSFGLTGRMAETLLRDILMTVNRNTVPNDVHGPWYTSGVRLGTPALTTRGMKEDEMRFIANQIADVLGEAKPADNPKTGRKSKAKANIEEKILVKARKEVESLLEQFPLYPELVIE